ncbi:22590_t:CDS:2, partial [Dentiscutata erythropus]
EFKKEWKQHEKQKTQLNNKYFTDLAKWICACPAYIQSHFFLCKHLVNSVEKADLIFFKKASKLVNMFNSEDTQNHENITFPLIQNPQIEHEDDYVIEGSDDEWDMYESELAYLHKVLDK